MIHQTAAVPQVGRLAWQVALALALALGFAGIGLYKVAQWRLELEVDNALRRDVARLLPSDAGKGPDQAGMAQALALLESERTISEKGHAVFDSAGRQRFGHIRLSFPGPGFSSVTFADGPHSGRDGRALAVRLRDDSWLVTVAQSEIVEDLGTTLLPLTASLALAAGLIGLLANVLLGRLLAERIERTTRVAGTISHGNLSERVPLVGLDGIFAVQAHAFNAMLDRMEDQIRNHQQFAWNVAHDLRTPLTRLRSLLTDRGTGGARSDEELTEQAERECDGLIRTFEALLRLAELESRAQTRQFAPLQLRDLVDELSETMEPVLADRGISLRFGPVDAGEIEVDRTLVTQLFVNLLENIALHTPAGTAAAVMIERDAASGMALITIDDNGPGLCGADPLGLLEPFARGHHVRAVPGSGLGLSVAQAIARFHGGTLTLQDRMPGLRAEITLPLTA